MKSCPETLENALEAKAQKSIRLKEKWEKLEKVQKMSNIDPKLIRMEKITDFCAKIQMVNVPRNRRNVRLKMSGKMKNSLSLQNSVTSCLSGLL